MNAYQLLDALGEGTRRAVVERLRGGPASVAEIAAELPVSRPAVSQHLKVLEQAGLVGFTVEGTRHVYALRREGFEELRRWVEGFWDDALARFAAAAEHQADIDRLPETSERSRV
ncbi:MAG: winged helix-turn-helix transcriptional regulator [Actinobacteria bacterium]|nr:winged helix-turn-helix transcriptional regulator [Actinomycetota bacterium]